MPPVSSLWRGTQRRFVEDATAHGHRSMRFVGDAEASARRLASDAEPGDVLLVFGAGDIDRQVPLANSWRLQHEPGVTNYAHLIARRGLGEQLSASAKPQGAARRGAEPLHEHRYRWTGDLSVERARG